MAPPFFLSKLGVNLAEFIDDDALEKVLEVDPPKLPKSPKISPLHFEIVDQKSAANLGDDVFVCVNGDNKDPNSAYSVLELDDDGDFVVDIDVTIPPADTLKCKFYLNLGADTLKKLPSSKLKLDSDGDVVIDVSFLKPNPPVINVLGNGVPSDDKLQPGQFSIRSNGLFDHAGNQVAAVGCGFEIQV